MAEMKTQAEPPDASVGAAPLPPSVFVSPSDFSANAIHLVRTSQQMNMTLSQMADTKASILMGATFLVFSVAVGQAANGTLPWSLGVLAVFAFISAMCAVFAVLPSVSGPASVDHQGGRANTLFFGTFAHMDEDEWTDGILADLRCDEALLRAMLRDIYQNGLVLQRKKYRFLAYAYKSFVAGLCLTAITFVLEFGVGLA